MKDQKAYELAQSTYFEYKAIRKLRDKHNLSDEKLESVVNYAQENYLALDLDMISKIISFMEKSKLNES